MKPLISIVEDDETLQQNYAAYLRKCGLNVDAYSTKEDALDGLRRRPPEFVLLDVELNGERNAGFEICTELRRRCPQLPIIFLTSHGDEYDKITGLAVGADDYITKDLSLKLIYFRIQSLFRRVAEYKKSGLEHHSSAATAPDSLSLDAVLSIATWRSRRLDLTLTQFWILSDLYRHIGQVRSHQQLMEAAYIVVEKNTIAAHIKQIRDEFRRMDPRFESIVTAHGRGYRWVPTEDVKVERHQTSQEGSL